MSNVLQMRRRIVMPQGDSWMMLKHNEFDTYVINIKSNGNQATAMNDGEWLKIVSNGKNQNQTDILINPTLTYADIKDKTCRFTWDIQCNEADYFEENMPTNATGNISFAFYYNQTNANINNRRGKIDFVKYDSFLGKHSVEFVPSQVMTASQETNFFAWNIGFRSNSSTMVISVMQLDFEVKM